MGAGGTRIWSAVGHTSDGTGEREEKKVVIYLGKTRV